jgi:hypothetical protein
MKKYKATQEQIRANLEMLSDTEIKTNDSFNVIHLNTPKGKKIIRTELTLEQWLKENNLIKKQKKK